MKTGITILDNAIGDIAASNLYCIACASEVDRLSLLAEVAIGLLLKDSGLAIVSTDYEQATITNELQNRYRSSCKGAGRLSLWFEHQPSITYSRLRKTNERIVGKNRKALQVFVVDNLLKIKTEFSCVNKELSIAANLYLLKMLATEYSIPVIAFSDLVSDESICTLLAKNEYVDKIVTCRNPRQHTISNAMQPIMMNNAHT